MQSSSAQGPFWQDGADTFVRVRVRAGAKQNRLVGIHNGSLKVEVKAAPERGAANEALVQFFSQLFSKPRNDVKVRHGHVSKDKLLVIHHCLCSDLVAVVEHHMGSSRE